MVPAVEATERRYAMTGDYRAIDECGFVHENGQQMFSTSGGSGARSCSTCHRCCSWECAEF